MCLAEDKHDQQVKEIEHGDAIYIYTHYILYVCYTYIYIIHISCIYNYIYTHHTYIYMSTCFIYIHMLYIYIYTR